MKITNTTDFPNHFLRRMISWCCKQVELSPRKLRSATFRGTRRAYSGCGGGGRITVRIGQPERFPVAEYERYGVKHVGSADQIEALVSVTSHEIYHVWQTCNGGFKSKSWNEPAAMNAQRTTLANFQANRENLLAAWNIVAVSFAADSSPKLTLLERRAAKVQAALNRWTRKLKIAQTKCKRLRAKVAYYERKRNDSQTKEDDHEG